MKITTKFFTLLIVSITIIALYGCQRKELSFTEKVEAANKMASEWIINNFKERGLFVYIYEPKKDFYPYKNNMIRQLMSSRYLAEMSLSDPKLLPLHEKNLEFIFRFWYQEKDDVGYIYYDGKSQIGSNAMLLRTLVYSPLFDKYQDKAKRISNSILKLMNEDGSLEPFFVKPGYTYDKDYLLTFYSGETILALVDYYNKTGDKNILEAAKKSQGYYIKRYVDQIDKNYYPAYVPWHTQSLSALYKLTQDKRYAEAIFKLNDRLLELQDTTKFVGRFYNPKTPQYGKPHSSSDGVYTEGLAYAYEIAKLAGDTKHQEAYRKAIEIAVDNLTSLQHKDKKDKKTYGAMMYKEGDDRIRTDTTQHAIDAFRKILEIF